MSEAVVPVTRTCARCQAPAKHHIRNDYLCSDCFTIFISTKIVKRMDGYKVRSAAHEIQRVLLPISLGPSSLTLLHLLDRQLKGQEQKTKRVGYELLVLHVDDPRAEGESDRVDAVWERLQQAYPRHNYLRLPLSEALSLFGTDELTAILYSSSETTSLPSPLTLHSLLASLPSPTSRTDFLLSLHRRLLAKVARELSYASIAMGHTSTRLAELVLSETSKGRGAALPLLVGDAAELEGIRCVFPARELMRGEIERWTREVETSVGSLSDAVATDDPARLPASGRDTTIDQLMTQYFSSVEVNYPSIVANVVRTSARLRTSDEEESDGLCTVCALPVHQGMAGLTGWGGDQAVSHPQHGEEKEEPEQTTILCYGCARTVEGAKGAVKPT